MSEAADSHAPILSRDRSDAVVIVAGPNLASLIDFYWRTLLDFQNCLEDVVGADGRLENLRALRWKFLGAIQSMEASLVGGAPVEEAHRFACVLEQGAPTLGLAGEALAKRLGLDDPEMSAAGLEAAMLELGEEVIARLPGEIPAAQGSTGQREIIRAMRMWSKAAEVSGEDMGFLAKRLEELG